MTKKFNYYKDLLSPDFYPKTIDGEICLYRKLDKYDIEISGLNDRRSKLDISIYVWDITKGLTLNAKCVFSKSMITSEKELIDTLNQIVNQYS